MQALRFYAAGDLRLDDIDDPVPGPGEVKVKLAACGICGTDLQEYMAGPIVIPTEDAPHPITGATPPVTLGHEMAGVVVAVGNGVTDIDVGSRVVIEPVVSCGTCPSCLRGAYNLCDFVCYMGLMGWGGGFAQYTVVPRRLIHPIPDDMSFELAALIEPIAVGWYALKEASFFVGQSAVVIGSGPIGAGTIVALRAAGAGWIGVSEPASARLAVAEELGCDLAVDPRERDVPDSVRTALGGGVDVAFETSGTQAGLDAALASVRKGGTVVNLALTEAPSQIDLTALLVNATRLVSSLAYAWVFPDVIAALGRPEVKVERLITARIPLDRVLEDGFDELVANRERHVKVMVTYDA